MFMLEPKNKSVFYRGWVVRVLVSVWLHLKLKKKKKGMKMQGRPQSAKLEEALIRGI